MSNVSAGLAPAVFLISGFAATQAEAAITVAPPSSTTTQTFNFVPTSTPTDIFIGGSTTAQYSLSDMSFTTLGNSQFGESFSYFAKDSAVLPTADTTFTSGSVATSPNSIQLRFDINGISNFGLARFDGFPIGPTRLVSIEYGEAAAVSGAVPEPDTWALMIAGFGAVGTAMRLSRRRRPQALAA